MYFPEKAQLGIPNKKNKHHFNNFHETTTGFMMPNVPFIKRIIPDTHINFNYDTYIRLDAMPMAPMGQANVKYNWYFVPMRCIWKPWMEFITQSVNHNGTTAGFLSSCPKVNTYNIYNGWLSTKGWVYTVNPNSTYDNFDYSVSGSYFKFTYEGIQINTVLNQLGYYPTDIKKDVSALPLLAFAKIILDHYIPKEWNDYEYTYNSIYNLFQRNDTYNLTQNDVDLIENLMKVCFLDNDYFTSAWKNMNGPNNTIAPITIQLPDNRGNIMPTNPGSEASLVKTGAVFTQYDLNMLKAMDEYLKKNQIIGTKYWDRLISQYGVKPAKALINISDKIDSKEVPIIFNQVFSTAETANSTSQTGGNLGDYAGSGHASIDNVFHFEYDTDEEGYLMCIVTIVPQVAYANGFDHEILCTTPLDYFNEQYDGMGAEAIESMELYTGYDLDSTTYGSALTVLTTQVWGFLPRGAWLKSMNNKVTGKMNLLSLHNEMSKWNFLRWMRKTSFSLSTTNIDCQNSLAFGLGTYDNSNDQSGYNFGTQYDRIFYNPLNHNFNIYMLYDWDQWNIMKPLYAYNNLDAHEDGEKIIHTSVNNHE